MSNSITSSNNRRRDVHKNTIKYNILLLGADSLGKSTFANNLLNKKIFTNDLSNQYKNIIPTVSEKNHSYPSDNEDDAVKITKPVKVALYTNGYNLLDSVSSSNSNSGDHQSDGENDALFHLKSVDVSISSDDEELNLTLLKSVCFGTSINNEQSITELQVFMEDLFDEVLAEETRIKRNPRFEDGRVHVTLYFLEPNGHGLKELDLKAMKVLSKYTNVLPIIARSDTFNSSELKEFKQKIMDDLDYYHIPVFKFSVSNDVLDEQFEEDLDTIKDNEYLDSIQPFSIVTSDEVNSDGQYYRSYNWMSNNNSAVLIDSMECNELAVLKRVLFGSHLQDFKDTMTNFLYETYRSNKLQTSFAQPPNPPVGLSQSPSFVDLKKGGQEDEHLVSSPSTPSLSNFQQLVINGQPSTYSLSRLAQQKPVSPSTVNDEANSSHNDFVSAAASTNEVFSDYGNDSVIRDKQNLRNISQTVPYQLTRDRLLHQKHKLAKIETDSAKELQKKIEELEKKAMELKKREKLLKLKRLQEQQQKEEQEIKYKNNNNDDVETAQQLENASFATEIVDENVDHTANESINNSVIKNEL